MSLVKGIQCDEVDYDHVILNENTSHETPKIKIDNNIVIEWYQLVNHNFWSVSEIFKNSPKNITSFIITKHHRILCHKNYQLPYLYMLAHILHVLTPCW